MQCNAVQLQQNKKKKNNQRIVMDTTRDARYYARGLSTTIVSPSEYLRQTILLFMKFLFLFFFVPRPSLEV